VVGEAGDINGAVYRFSRRKVLPLLIIVLVPCVWIGSVLIHRPLDEMLWLGFGACFLAAIRFGLVLVDRRPRIIIDRRGIFDRSCRVGIIPWSEVTSVHPPSSQSRFVQLELKESERWVAKMPPIRRWLAAQERRQGQSGIAINLTMVDAAPEKIYALLRTGLEAARNAQPR
jgi:hypothetical protein